VPNDRRVLIDLEALRKAISLESEDLFWDSVAKLGDLSTFFNELTLRSWGWFFSAV
jgi:hypothetical protein